MIMAISFPSPAAVVSPCLKPLPKASNFYFQFYNKNISYSTRLKCRPNYVVFCESPREDESANRRSKLEVGSPVVFVEAPRMIKTATSISCLKVNSGLVKAGDVGRIVARKPMDVWAIRLSIGTYLVDGKYFIPLELDHQ